MALLYVGSIASHSGKNLVCLGLARRMLDDGFKVAYFKPYGANPTLVDGVFTDSEAWMVNEALNLGQTPEECCPVVRTQDLVAQVLRHECGDNISKVRGVLDRLSADADVVLMSGCGTLASGAACGVDSFGIAQTFKPRIVLVDRYDNEFYLDNVIRASMELPGGLMGVVINSVDKEMNDALDGQVVTYLNEERIPVLGKLPKDDLLGAVAVQTLSDMLGGSILVGLKHADRLVKHFFIGAMQVSNAPRFFRGSRDFACIVGGDRPDMQMAAIDSGAAALILTGNFYPSDIILSRAEEHAVTVIVVRDDTYTVAHRVERLRNRISLAQDAKIKRGIELVLEGLDFGAVYEKLGLKK